jgi:lysophospholipase L1-like esterase
VLVGLCLICVLYLLTTLFLAGGDDLIDRSGESSVHFAADRNVLFAPGDCTTLRWSVDGVREVYIVGQPTLGSSTLYGCFDRSLPKLTVVLRDGERREYNAPIQFLIDQPQPSFAIGAAVLSLMALLLVRCAPAYVRESAAARQPQAEPAPLASHERIARLVGGCLSNVGAIALFLLIAYVVLEGLVRLYFGYFGTQDDRIRYVMSDDEIAQLDRGNIRLPALEYGLNPRDEDINPLGWRGEDVAIPKPPGTYRVVAIGASTTYGFTPPDETYPAWMERILHEQYGLSQVEVVNAGVSGYTTWNSMISLATKVLELDPDLVIIYDATNDVLTRDVTPDCYAGHNALRGLDPRMFMTRGTIPSLGSSALLRFIGIRSGSIPDPTLITGALENRHFECAPGVFADRAAPQVTQDTQLIQQNPPVYYERNLRTMIGIASVHDIAVMLPTWAYWEATIEPGIYWSEAIAEHNQIVRQLADEYELLTVDYAELAPQDVAFWSDYIHMNSDGSRHQAQTFAGYLVEQDVFTR